MKLQHIAFALSLILVACGDSITETNNNAGNMVCAYSLYTANPEGCTATWDRCTDGRKYEFKCVGDSCKCRVNDLITGEVPKDAACSDSGLELNQQANETCEWQVPGL